jgi:hypothetical protein
MPARVACSFFSVITRSGAKPNFCTSTWPTPSASRTAYCSCGHFLYSSMPTTIAHELA